MIRAMFRPLVRIAALVLVAFLLLRPSAASAQMGMGMGGPDESVSRRSIEGYSKILGLDNDQKEALKNLYEGYRKDHEAAGEKMQAEMRAAQDKFADTQDLAGVQKEAIRASKRHVEHARKLVDTFHSEFKLLLTDEQLAKWAKVEQYRRRDRHLRMAMVSGSAVDLVRIVERVKAVPADNTEFASVLDRYELAMDKHLLELERVSVDAEARMFDAEADMMDMGRWGNIFKEYYPVSREMRETNKEYTRKLAMLMDDASRQKFEDEVKARAFPRVYKPMHVVKMLDTALTLPDVDAAKKTEIREVREALLRDAGPANERWAKAMEERDDAGGGSIAVMMASMQGKASELNKGVNEARQARKELEAKARERLENLLTEEQRQKLPQPPRDSGNPWLDMMPQDDE